MIVFVEESAESVTSVYVYVGQSVVVGVWFGQWDPTTLTMIPTMPGRRHGNRFMNGRVVAEPWPYGGEAGTCPGCYRTLMYQTVLNEAGSMAELNRWLDADTLLRLWPTLWLPAWLPAAVRSAWQSRFPDLEPPRALAG